MTDGARKKFAQRFRELLDGGAQRKPALLQVRQEIRALNPKLPRGRATIYGWCKKFRISTR